LSLSSFQLLLELSLSLWDRDRLWPPTFSPSSPLPRRTSLKRPPRSLLLILEHSLSLWGWTRLMPPFLPARTSLKRPSHSLSVYLFNRSLSWPAFLIFMLSSAHSRAQPVAVGLDTVSC